MSDDVDAKLAALEARLAELELETSAPAEPPARAAPPPPREPAPVPAPEPEPEPPRREPPAQPDHLEQFGVELRRLSHELVSAYDRVLEHERRAGAEQRVVIEVQAGLSALAAFERALAASPGVRAVELQAYAGGRASLVVDLS